MPYSCLGFLSELASEVVVTLASVEEPVVLPDTAAAVAFSPAERVAVPVALPTAMPLEVPVTVLRVELPLEDLVAVDDELPDAAEDEEDEDEAFEAEPSALQPPVALMDV